MFAGAHINPLEALVVSVDSDAPVANIQAAPARP